MYATRILSSLGAATMLAALAVPAAPAIGPDDRDLARATSPALLAEAGPDDRSFSRSRGLEGTNASPASPVDRLYARSIETAPSATPVEVVVGRPGFDWSDAVVGAAGALGIAALVGGVALLGRGVRRGDARDATPTIGSV